MGKIANADAVGKVGNPVCITPYQKIHVGNSLKAINEISKNDAVLSHNGMHNSVTNIVSRNHTGKIVTIKNKMGTVK